jgi:hypothetical protein
MKTGGEPEGGPEGPNRSRVEGKAERVVAELLQNGEAMGIDAICGASGLTFREVAGALVLLEMKGLVSRCADGRFEGI